MIKLLATLLIASMLSGCAFLDDAQQGWLKNNVKSFQTTKPGSGFRDIAFLKDLVGDAEVVGLAETMSGVREFIEIKHRITEYLATNLGFSVLALEIGVADASRINSYIHGDTTNLVALLRNFPSQMIYSEEGKNLINWMREFNRSGKGRIDLMGYDMEYMSTASDSVVGFLKKYEPDYAEKAERIYKEIKEQILTVKQQKSKARGIVEYPSGQYAALANRILDHMQVTIPDYYRKSASNHDVIRVIQYANAIVQTTILQLTDLDATPFRDSCRAENIRWIKDDLPSGSKIILWPNYGQIADKYLRVGSYLRDWYRKKYMSIGFKFNQGTYSMGGGIRNAPATANTLEAGFRLINIPRFMLDLRKASREDDSTKWLFRDQRTRGTFNHLPFTRIGAIGDLYDAVVYIDTVHGTGSIQ